MVRSGFRGVNVSTASMLLWLLFLLVLHYSCFISAAGTSSMDLPMQFSRAELVRIAGYGEERLSSVLVVGKLRCEACMKVRSRSRASYVSGAKVAVACRTDEGNKRSDWAHGTTDEYGEFTIDLPSELHAIPRLEEACTVRVLRMPNNSFCGRTLDVKPRRIRLSSVGNSIRLYTAGIVRLRHKDKPYHECSKKREGTWQ